MNTTDYIKPGAFVRLRDGSKAEIYSTDNGGAYPVHGRVFNPDGTAHVVAWMPSGWESLLGEPRPADIIGPWVERPDYSKLWPLLPPWIKWLARDEDGALFGYTSKPDRMTTSWTSGGLYFIIPYDYRPEPIGDWKDSLQERPTP